MPDVSMRSFIVPFHERAQGCNARAARESAGDGVHRLADQHASPEGKPPTDLHNEQGRVVHQMLRG